MREKENDGVRDVKEGDKLKKKEEKKEKRIQISKKEDGLRKKENDRVRKVVGEEERGRGRE